MGNQLHQNKLALEGHWYTKDPWFMFMIDWTVVGICDIDTDLAAQHQNLLHVQTLATLQCNTMTCIQCIIFGLKWSQANQDHALL